MFSRYSQQRGVALISVLLVVVILLAVASRLLMGHNLTISQNQNAFSADQALQYALGAESMAREALREDFVGGGGAVDHLNELWAQQTLPFELDEGGFLEAQLHDLQGCFNLNNIVGSKGADAVKQFKRLLRNLGLADSYADTWNDWVDADQVVTNFGAEDSEYLIAEIPHRTPNVLVTHTSELTLLQNASKEDVDKLRPEVCLLPVADSPINVNTARPHTLAALDDKISPATVEALAASDREYESPADFIAEFDDFAPAADFLSVTSEYFQLHSYAQVGDSSVTLLSLLHRDPATGDVTVLSRDFGKLFRSDLDTGT